MRVLEALPKELAYGVLKRLASISPASKNEQLLQNYLLEVKLQSQKKRLSLWRASIGLI